MVTVRYIFASLLVLSVVSFSPSHVYAFEPAELQSLIEQKNCKVRASAIEDIIRIARGRSSIGLFTALAFASDFRCQQHTPHGFVDIPVRMVEVLSPKFEASVVRYVRDKA